MAASSVPGRRVRSRELLDEPVAAFVIVDAPFGPVHVAVSDGGIEAVSFETETPAFADGLARRLHGAVVPAEVGAEGGVPEAWRAELDDACRQIGEYFSGRRRSFTARVPLTGLSPWDRLVLRAAADVPFGETASYGEIAMRIGRRGAARAVGAAMSRSPVGLFIPCHRVIAAGRRIGGYGGSSPASQAAAIDFKRRLLEFEGTFVGPN